MPTAAQNTMRDHAQQKVEAQARLDRLKRLGEWLMQEAPEIQALIRSIPTT